MHELLSRVSEELRYAWRFRWYAILVAWLVCVAGWLVVYSLPNQYQADARVQIDTESIIHPLIGGLAVKPDYDQQVDLLIHTVLNRPNLKEIARSTGLDIRATTPAAEDSLLAGLGNRIQIRNERNNINLYSVAYTGNDADTAQAVVQEVLNIMTGMALGNTTNDSARAMAFLNQEVENYRAQLNTMEQRLAEFKKEHGELLPGEYGFVSRLQSTQSELNQQKNRLSTAMNRQAALQGQVQSLGSSSRTVSPEQSPEVQSIDAQLEQDRAQLTQLLSRYTDQHPDVIALEDTIARLQQQRQQAVAELRANPVRVPGANTAVYEQVSQQLNDVEVEISTLRASIEQKTALVEELRSGADQTTDVQAEQANLMRNYDVTQRQYENLLNRLYSARLSQDISASGDRLKFRIVDPPEAPASPSGPPRTIFMTAVLLLGLGAGAVFALFLSQVRPVFMSRRKLTEVTGYPVLGAVSMAWSVRQRMQRRTGVMVFALAMGGLLVGYLAAVAFVPIGAELVPNILSNRWL